MSENPQIPPTPEAKLQAIEFLRWLEHAIEVPKA